MTRFIASDRIETIIRELSTVHILPRFRALQAHEIDTKTGPTDLVTAADIEMEKALAEILCKELPGSVFMGEEMVSRGEIDMIAPFEDPPEFLWVVDPVDGTYNFAHGSEIFACMVALQHRGETVMSWIYNVMRDKFAVAELGGGATYGGRSLHTASPKNLEELHGYAGRYYAPKELRQIWEEKEQEVATVGGIRCAAHSYLRVARGFVDFHIYANTKPWDHLAGDLLVREAGGTVRRWDNTAYDPADGKKGLLVAANDACWEDIYDVFLDGIVRNTLKNMSENTSLESPLPN